MTFIEHIEHIGTYFSEHIVLANTSHFLGGFGLALILQNYFVGNAFLSDKIGWAMIGFYISMHVMALLH